MPPFTVQQSMTIQQIIALIKADLQTLATKLGIVGQNLLDSIDFAKMEQIAQDAFLAGGVAAVVPALIANVNAYISNPYEAAMFAIALRFLGEYLLGHGLPNLRAAGMGSAATAGIPGLEFSRVTAAATTPTPTSATAATAAIEAAPGDTPSSGSPSPHSSPPKGGVDATDDLASDDADADADSLSPDASGDDDSTDEYPPKRSKGRR